IIFDRQLQPQLLSQATGLLFPVETVYGCVEVKTTLRADDIADIRSHARALRELKMEPEKLIVPRMGTDLEFHSVDITHPGYFVLAYGTEVAMPTIIKRFAEAETIERPDLLVVITPGLVAGVFGEIFGEPKGTFVGGLTLLHG